MKQSINLSALTAFVFWVSISAACVFAYMETTHDSDFVSVYTE